MSSTTLSNGKPQRKQLADQLDRLDGIIDALAEGLNQAVADASREGTRLAVKDAIVEILSNAELRALLVPQAPAPAPIPTSAANPPAPPVPGVWSRIKGAAAVCGGAAAGVAGRAKAAAARRCATAREAVAAVGRATGEALPARRVLVVGLAVGAVVGAACLVAPNAVSAVAGGVGAAVAAIGAQVGGWLARAARRAGLLN